MMANVNPARFFSAALATSDEGNMGYVLWSRSFVRWLLLRQTGFGQAN